MLTAVVDDDAGCAKSETDATAVHELDSAVVGIRNAVPLALALWAALALLWWLP